MKLFSYKKVRYLISGTSAFVIEYACFALLISLTSNLLLSNTISFIVGVGVGFVFHKFWSFSGNHQLHARSQILATFSMGLFNLFFTNTIISILVTALDISPYISKIITLIIIVIWNYVIFNYVVFRHKKTPID